MLHKLTAKQLDQLRKACDLTYRASYHGGSRRKWDIKTGVIHSTDGGKGQTAQGNARYLAGPDAGGSTQLVIDDKICYRILGDLEIPYGAPGANMEGVHIEQVGTSTWSREEWLRRYMTLHHTAYKMAVWCHIYNFPPIWLSVDALKNGNIRGVTSHNNVSLAYKRSDHTDPGVKYPYDYFLAALKKYYKDGH